MTHKERMLRELPYKAWMDGLMEEHLEAQKKIYAFNQLPPDRWEEVPVLLQGILGKMGEKGFIKPPFHCDYGSNIEVGDNFFANYHFTVLDVAKVIIGDNVMIAPNVSIYTAGHPLHPDSRNSGYEYGIGITIGNNVWIGANSVVLPGVKIGDNSVIGAGSVVTRDIPSGVVAVGIPCRVLREIGEKDERTYYRDWEIDIE